MAGLFFNFNILFLFFNPIQLMTRKQSLVNQSTNPFVVVIQKLDQLPNNINDITREQIVSLTESLVGWGSPDDLMAMAKTSSRTLFIELEPNERVQVINNLVSNSQTKICIRFLVIFVFLYFF